MLNSGVEVTVNELREKLEAADPATLLLALVQISGERHWLEAAKPFIRGPMSYQETMPEPLAGADPRPARASARQRMPESRRGRPTMRCSAR